MLKKYLATLALSVPLCATAAQPIAMSCEMTVKEFFAPLVQNKLISTKPTKVESSSVNHFRPALFKQLTVFGMPVIDVFGYTNDPLLFVQAGPRDRQLHGVTVREQIANVQAQLRSVGENRARTFRADASSTIIACEGDAI